MRAEVGLVQSVLKTGGDQIQLAGRESEHERRGRCDVAHGIAKRHVRRQRLPGFRGPNRARDGTTATASRPAGTSTR